MTELTCQELLTAPFGLREVLLLDTPTDLAQLPAVLQGWYHRSTPGGGLLIYLRQPEVAQDWAARLVDMAEVGRDDEAVWYELQRPLAADAWDQLAAFTGEAREAVVGKSSAGIFRTKTAWQEADTATPAERAQFYARTDAYLYELVGYEPPIPVQPLAPATTRHFELAHGTGRIVLTVAQQAYIDAFDLSEPMRGFLKFRVERYYPHLAARIRVLDEWDSLPADSYDAVHAYHVLEHLEDPLASLRRLVALLRPGGQIAVIAPFEAIGPEYPEHNPALAHLTVPGLFAEVGVHLRETWKVGEWDAFGGVKPRW
ncbi:MAG: class I SAM-dependent methyltransferase [Fimbriimonadaceae bacterium]|nr:class I SAM-dependent methyltransferase [Fimbriimonadaceae bacterium]